MASVSAAPGGSSNEVQLLIKLASDSNGAAAAGSAMLHRLLANTPAMADDLVQHVPALLRHATLSSAGPSQVFAASVLLRLLDHPSAASAVARADLQPLLAALQSCPADDDNATAQLAATLLSSLATTHEGALALAPRVPQLLAAAAAHHQQGPGDDSSATVSALLQAVTCAGQIQPQALRPAVEAAGELLQMLDSPDPEQQEAAAKLLNMLLLLPEGAAALAQDCHISGLLELLQRQLQQQPQAAGDDAPATAQQQDQQRDRQAAGMSFLYAAQVLAAVAARPAGAAALAQRRRVAALMRCLQVPSDRLGRLVLSALAHVTAAAAAAPGGLAAPQLLLKPEHVQQLVDAAGRDGLTLLALQALVPLGTCGSCVQLLAAQLGRLQRAVDDMQQRQEQEQQQEEQEGDDDGDEADGQPEQQQQAADAVSQARLLLQAIASRVAAFQAVMQQNHGPAVREMQHAVIAFASVYASSMHSRSQASASKRHSCSSPPGSSGRGHGCQQHQELLQQAGRLAEACNRHFSVAAFLEAAAAGARQPDCQPGGGMD